MKRNQKTTMTKAETTSTSPKPSKQISVQCPVEIDNSAGPKNTVVVKSKQAPETLVLTSRKCNTTGRDELNSTGAEFSRQGTLGPLGSS